MLRCLLFALSVTMPLLSTAAPRALAAPAVPAASRPTAPARPAAAPAAMAPGGGEWRDFKPADSAGRGKSGEARGVSSGVLVVVAYGIIWAVLLVYVLILSFRQRRLSQELGQLGRRLQELGDERGERSGRDGSREAREGGLPV